MQTVGDLRLIYLSASPSAVTPVQMPFTLGNPSVFPDAGLPLALALARPGGTGGVFQTCSKARGARARFLPTGSV